MTPVQIEWVDAVADNSGWSDVKEKRKECNPLPCTTVGFLIKKTKKKVVVCISHDYDNGNGDYFFTIPMSCIKSIKELTQ